MAIDVMGQTQAAHFFIGLVASYVCESTNGFGSSALNKWDEPPSS
jgi:hypothetical protein